MFNLSDQTRNNIMAVPPIIYVQEERGADITSNLRFCNSCERRTTLYNQHLRMSHVSSSRNGLPRSRPKVQRLRFDATWYIVNDELHFRQPQSFSQTQRTPFNTPIYVSLELERVTIGTTKYPLCLRVQFATNVTMIFRDFPVNMELFDETAFTEFCSIANVYEEIIHNNNSHYVHVLAMYSHRTKRLDIFTDNEYPDEFFKRASCIFVQRCRETRFPASNFLPSHLYQIPPPLHEHYQYNNNCLLSDRQLILILVDFISKKLQHLQQLRRAKISSQNIGILTGPPLNSTTGIAATTLTAPSLTSVAAASSSSSISSPASSFSSLSAGSFLAPVTPEDVRATITRHV